ncbi:mitochondrial carrier domain-containing protein [Lasiosphaeria ovina]|uniref:Mitochondrial carrier domain-containing protein n=1 Tax=Lasiosphaeria ovina TaxID=92902 RepID=A0AAE0NE53_9PEZI|nr:mitochondrial carrier domain-containing protein [Lasiosphaeria ovina]
MPRASKLLPSIGHAASGAGGTVISTLATYPLDLVNTRLKVQRQLRADGSIGPGDGYAGVADAFASIYAGEGGLAAFFAGLGADLAKSAADSFLFFLFYTWFRSRRLHARNHAPHLSPLEELAVGAVAGACCKAFTTPVSNVVTRRQTASLVGARSSNSPSSQGRERQQEPQHRARDLTFGEIVADMRRENGLLGLWAGYSASLVLTLNPSTTFFLQQFLKRTLVPRHLWDDPGARTTFFLAAVSKVVATSLTYPFQIAKARVQVSASSVDDRKKKQQQEESEVFVSDEHGSAASALVSRIRDIAGDNIFATVLRIARAEGVRALYDGIGGELLKGFFSHGTTMLSKDTIHRFIVRLYFAILVVLQQYPQIRSRILQRTRELREEYLRALSQAAAGRRGRSGVRYVQNAFGLGQRFVAGIMWQA